MKKLKVTSRFKDKVTGETFVPGTVIDRNNERSEALVSAKVAEEYDGPQDLTLDELSSQVATADAKQLDALVEAEKSGSNRVGAQKLFDSRRAELDADTTAKAAPAKSAKTSKK